MGESKKDKPQLNTMERISCQKCNREFYRKDFYLDKNGNPMKDCKKCMAMLIDLNSRSTVMGIMEEIDIPFIPAEWETLKDKYEFSRDKRTDKLVRNKNANQAVLGRYIGKMKLQQFAQFTFKDTPRFIEEHEGEMLKQRENLHKKLDQLLEDGYDVDTAMQIMSGKLDNGEEEDPGLTKAQIKDLKLKWGSNYESEELIKLETFYAEMHESYDISSASHEDYLKQIVKTSMRMHSLIDAGMFEEYQRLSGAYDKMMKSAKFTASQEKQEDQFIDSISEMVRLCEEKGFIPIFHTDEPLDIVDVTLKDLNTYTRNLVKEELNLDSLVEKGMEQIKLEEEKELMSEDDALFMDSERENISEDDLVFELIEEESGGKI